MHLSLSPTKNIEGSSRTDCKIVDLPRPATFSIDMHIAPMLNVAGLGRSLIFQSVGDGPSIFLVELRDKRIYRSSQATRHSQVDSILHESGTIPH